jgi:hypothetical protein
MTAVIPAWGGMATTTKEMRPKIEPQIRESVTPIFTLQIELQEKIQQGCMTIITPILEDKVKGHLSKIVDIIMEPGTLSRPSF